MTINFFFLPKSLQAISHVWNTHVYMYVHGIECVPACIYDDHRRGFFAWIIFYVRQYL